MPKTAVTPSSRRSSQRRSSPNLRRSTRRATCSAPEPRLARWTGMARLLSPGPCAMTEAELSIGILPAVCDLPVPPKAKKADVVERLKLFHHVGLRFDEPPGRAGLSFT